MKYVNRMQEYFLITVGSCIYAAGLSFFLDPNNLVPGGVTGIAMILNRMTGIETGSLIFILNIPILLLGMWKFGWKFILSTGYALLLISVFSSLFAGYGALTDDKLLSCLVGAVMVAFGIGLIFRCHATTGGADIIVKILRQKYPKMKTGGLFFLFDTCVILLTGLFFKNVESMIYALVTVVVVGFTLDKILYGKDQASLFYIISDHSKELTQRLLTEADIGVTTLHGTGAYTGKEKEILLCVTQKKQSLLVEDIVKEIDPEAFFIAASANEIYGEGYKDFFAEKL